MDDRQFLTTVAEYAALPSRDDAGTVIRAVLDVLTERLTGSQAAAVTAYVPAPIAAGLTGAGRHVEDSVFRRADFVTRIAAAEGTDVDTADLHAGAVLHTVQQTIPDSDIHDVRTQLPQELTELLA